MDELLASAELGEEARKFIESDLGKCLLGMAQQEISQAQELLEIVDPTDIEKVRDLQGKAKLGRYFEQWLLELLHTGEEALEAFKREQTE